jgi:hypothetical protein
MPGQLHTCIQQIAMVTSVEQLRNAGGWHELRETKPVWIEPKDNVKLQLCIEEYEQSIQDGDGGLLLAVCRGKVCSWAKVLMVAVHAQGADTAPVRLVYYACQRLQASCSCSPFISVQQQTFMQRSFSDSQWPLLADTMLCAGI